MLSSWNPIKGFIWNSFYNVRKKFFFRIFNKILKKIQINKLTTNGFHSTAFSNCKRRKHSKQNFAYYQLTVACGISINKLSKIQMEAIKLSGYNFAPPDFSNFIACSIQLKLKKIKDCQILINVK